MLKTLFFSCFFFFFLIIDLNVLIPAVIEEIINPTIKLAMPTGMSTKETKAKIETYVITAKAKISMCSM